MSEETNLDIESEYLDTAQLSALLRCSPTALRRRIYRGRIPQECIIQRGKGSKLLFSRRLVKKLLLASTGRAL